MELQNERQQIVEVCQSFRYNVAKPSWATSIWSKNKQLELLEQIEKLNPQIATQKDIENILGKPWYIAPKYCDECGVPNWKVVLLGERPDYESSTARICVDCLKAALKLCEDDNVTA